ncbi:MAG: thioredoxin domain-containing protein, partial [Geminicoccaceae bacterium]
GFAMLENPMQIVLIGSGADPALGKLKEAALAAGIPGATVQVTGPDRSLPTGHPAHGKGLVDGQAAAYVCEGQTCRLPITDPAELSKQLDLKRLFSD